MCKELPQEIIFFVYPPLENSNTVNFVEPVYELYLSPGEQMKNGWRELNSE